MIARRVLRVLRVKGADVTYGDLAAISGLGAAKIPVILASFELARRYLLEPDRPVIDSAKAAYEQLKHITTKQQEYFLCLTLDGAQRLITTHVISIGTLTASLVHPREVFAPAIADRAASILVAHNHPSGALHPSQADIDITHRLDQAGQLLGIALVDHVIVSREGYKSIFYVSES